MNKKLLIALAALGSLASADTIYNSQQAFEAAVTGTIITEDFSKNPLASGVQILTCQNAPDFKGCQPYDSGGGYWGGIAPGSFTDSIGEGSYEYRSTLFQLPNQTTALAFNFTSLPVSEGYPLQISLMNYGTPLDVVKPEPGFWGIIVPDSEEFSQVEISYGNLTYSISEMEIDPSVLTPEPATLALFGLAALSLGLWKRKNAY